MQFIDEATIEVFAGHGGAGARSFRREKFVPYGGPDGGNGGHGGSVILQATSRRRTLLDFRHKKIWKAGNGKPGEGRLKDGKSGEDCLIEVPVGTEVLNTGAELIIDLSEDNQQFVLAKGGRGGKGNTFFKSATNRTPDHAQPGEEGEEGTFTLSLKLLADVGLVGFPNAGKSTLLSRISQAKPKVADYPFTTLEPIPGVVKSKSGKSFVVADIPGLIEDAHLGKGLGTQFLKHIERTSVLLHVIDSSPLLEEHSDIPEPLESYQLIRKELEQYSAELLERKALVVLTKADLFEDPTSLQKICDKFEQQKIRCSYISAVDGTGLDELIEALAVTI